MGTLSVVDFSATLEEAMGVFDSLASIHPLSRNASGKNIGDAEGNSRSNARFQNKYRDVSIDDGNTSASQPDLIRVLEDAAGKEWAEQISEQDPRFVSLLPPGCGTLQERIDRLISEPDSLSSVSQIPALVDSILRIEGTIAQVMQSSLEDCLSDFLKLISRTDGERLQVLGARFGWCGAEPITLEECGKQLGLTRERIRQIQASAVKRIPKHQVFMPKLDEALALLEQRAPITLTDGARILNEEGITKRDFHPSGVLEAARLLGRETGLTVREVRGAALLINPPDADVLRLVPRLARKLAGQSGVTSIFQVAEVVRETGLEVDETRIKPMLSSSNFEFLDEDWFWATDVKDSRNRLYNVTKKMLSVASPQSILSIRDGVRRHYRWRMFSNEHYKTLTVPPLMVLETFYRRHRAFRVEGAMLYPSEPLDYARELGEADRLFVDVLRSSPSSLLDRDSLAEACLRRGMNQNTFSVYTSYSPILEHVDIGIWKLRGVIVDPTAVEAIRIANHIKPRQKRVLQWGWGEDGSLWIAARVPKIVGSMVIGCPGPIRRLLDGNEFACLTKDGGYSCGTVTFNDRGTSYGYGVFLRRFGVDENDILLAEFDVSNGTVALSVADDEVLDYDA